MTDVDDFRGNGGTAQVLDYFPRIRSRAAWSRDFIVAVPRALSSFLAYLAIERGPTSSASALVYGAIAAGGAVLYEAWTIDAADTAPTSREPFCERGCLRRAANDLRLKTADEIRLHQDMFARRWRQQRGVGLPRTLTWA
jgi:hypothetical protein